MVNFCPSLSEINPDRCKTLKMPIDKKLLDILVCPVTKQPVFPLEPALLEKLNALVADGKIELLDGSVVSEAVQEALITRNKTTIYRVENGIPIMLEDQGIAADQLD